MSTEADLKAMTARSPEELEGALVEYGIPRELVLRYSGGGFALYNNAGQGLSRQTGEDEWRFTQFPDGYLDRVKEQVDQARGEGRLEAYISSVTGAHQSMLTHAATIGSSSASAVEPDTVEERIAAFLEQHGVSIDCVPGGDGRDMLRYYWRRPDGEVVELGETVYDARTGVAEAVPGERAILRHQLEGFVTNVTRPMARLLRQTNGQFLEHDRFEPIHAALDRVEARY